MEKRTLMLTDLLDMYFQGSIKDMDIKIESIELFIPLYLKSDFEYDDQKHILKAKLNRQSTEMSDIKISYSIREKNNVYKPQ